MHTHLWSNNWVTSFALGLAASFVTIYRWADDYPDPRRVLGSKEQFNLALAVTLAMLLPHIVLLTLWPHGHRHRMLLFYAFLALLALPGVIAFLLLRFGLRQSLGRCLVWSVDMGVAVWVAHFARYARE